MKALVVEAYGPPENAHVAEIESPTVKDGYLLVRMHAAGVNQFDYKIVTGAVKDWVPVTFPYVPGMDGAGEIVEVGGGVTGWTKGDAIVGMFGRGGAFAEYALISASEKRLARKPERLDFKHAAAIPESGLTAKTIVHAASVKPNQTALVVGATGGVGLFVTQLLKAEGARVIATGKANDVEYLSQLGADEVVDYSGDVAAQVRRKHPQGVDIMVDLINTGDALLASAQALRKGGTLVSSLYGPEQSAYPNGVTVHYIQLTAEPGDLEDLAQRAADGKLRIEVGHTYDLSHAAQALADLMDPAKHTRGKFVIRVST